MKFIHRLGFFSIGLIMGIALLIFFLSGKRTTCDYSPTARVLKNIRIKDRDFSLEAIKFFEINQLDTSWVSSVLHNGNVDFGRSNTKLDSCKVYFISGEVDTRNIEVQIENCDSIATVQKVEFIKQ